VGRLNAWQASIAMANDYPVLGVGLDNFLFMFQYYAPDPENVHVAHNTWLQMLAETGYVGLSLYVLLFATTWWTLWRVRRRARRYGMRWAETGGRCLMASLVAFMVGGTFLNRAHFDLIYHLMGLTVALERVLAHEIALARSEPEESVAARAA
jgi:O-antigen ligase